MNYLQKSAVLGAGMSQSRAVDIGFQSLRQNARPCCRGARKSLWIRLGSMWNSLHAFVILYTVSQKSSTPNSWQ